MRPPPSLEARIAALEQWKEDHMRSQERRDAREWKTATLIVTVAALIATVIGLLLR